MLRQIRYEVPGGEGGTQYSVSKHLKAPGEVVKMLASYPGSLIIAGEEKRAWFQSLTHALNCPGIPGRQYTTVIFRLMYDVSSRFI